jgi:hypothetical protein
LERGADVTRSNGWSLLFISLSFSSLSPISPNQFSTQSDHYNRVISQDLQTTSRQHTRVRISKYGMSNIRQMSDVRYQKFNGKCLEVVSSPSLYLSLLLLSLPDKPQPVLNSERSLQAGSSVGEGRRCHKVKRMVTSLS